MRQAGRLLKHMRQLSTDKAYSMSEFIIPTKFKTVLQAARHCAGCNDKGSEFQTPSYALKSGGLVRRLAEIKQSQALQKSDTVNAECCVQFLKLVELNWTLDISAVALRNLSERKRCGVRYLPLTEDVVKLNQYLVSQGNEAVQKLTTGSDSETYMRLTQLTLVKTILFNRQRQGEVSKITVDDYEKKAKGDCSHEMTKALTEFERCLLNVLERVEIRGKKDRTVPVLLTEEMNTWIQKMLQYRCTFVPVTNKFLFATSGELSHFRGSDVLRQFASESGATKPHLLTSTKLRKHIASTVQVVSLREHEMDGLARFLGHDLRVHRDFYRLPNDIIEIARISKLFLAAEKGVLVDFAGKELADVTIAPEEEVASSDDTEGDEETEDRDWTEKSASELPLQRPQVDNLASVSEKRLQRQQESVNSTVQEQHESDFEETEYPKAKKRKMPVRRKWTASEKDEVAKHFAKEIVNKCLPGKSAIDEFLKKTGINRKWSNVKDFLRNQYLK